MEEFARKQVEWNRLIQFSSSFKRYYLITKDIEMNSWGMRETVRIYTKDVCNKLKSEGKCIEAEKILRFYHHNIVKL